MMEKGVVRVGIWMAVSTKAQIKEAAAEWEKQESDGRRWAEANGGRVVEVFAVPGHSRRYFSLEKLAAAAEKKDIDAFTRLMTHFENPQMDVLWVRDGDRFARTQSLFARIVEELITAKVAIYSEQDDLLIKSMKRARDWISDVGKRAASDVDKLVEFRRNAMTNNAFKGLPVSSGIPMTHHRVRDEKTGKTIAMKFNPNYRRLMDDVALLLLEGVGYMNLEKELYARHGHANERGEQWQPGRMYSLLMNPITWGNVARWHRTAKPRRGRWQELGDWIMEPGHSIPEGVLIAYNVIDPVYAGNLAEQVKAEIRRRRHAIRGSASAKGTHLLTGLVYCKCCGYTMPYYRQGNELKCMSHWNISPTRPDCEQRRTITEQTIVAWLDSRLRQMVDANDAALFTQPEKDNNTSSSVTSLRHEIEMLDASIRQMIRQQASAHPDAQDIFAQEIDKDSTRLRRLREVLKDAERAELKAAQSSAQQMRALDEIRKLTVDVFWLQEPRFINQTLHALMGDRVIAIEDGEIQGSMPRPKRARRTGA